MKSSNIHTNLPYDSLPSSSNKGLYIHIPFCHYLCPYCDFTKTARTYSHHQFILSLIKEFETLKLKKYSIETIYLGGGTPSLLEEKALIQLIKHLIPFTHSQTEWTIEANPEDVNIQWINTIKNLPFNRISLGIQSFNEKELKILNRQHSKKEALKACQLIQKKTPHITLSIDLMTCLPQQTWEDFKENLHFIDILQLNHISIYNLSLDQGSLWGNLKEQGKLKIKELSDNDQAHILEKTFSFMENKNFTQYEISNFARNKCFSQHNLRYWKRKTTLAIGPGAVSFDAHKQKRTLNTSSIQDYLTSSKNWSYKTEFLTKKEQLFEEIMVGLRSYLGVPLNILPPHIQPLLSLWKKEKYIKVQNSNFYLLKKGRLIYNSLVVELMHQIES